MTMTKHSTLVVICLIGTATAQCTADSTPYAQYPVDKAVSSWLQFNGDGSLLAYRCNLDESRSCLRVWKLKDGTHNDIEVNIGASDSRFPLDCRFVFDKDELLLGQGNTFNTVSFAGKPILRHAADLQYERAKRVHHSVDKGADSSVYWSQVITETSHLSISAVIKRDGQWKAIPKGEVDFGGSRITSSCVTRDGRSLIVGTTTEKEGQNKYALTVWDLQANRKLYERQAHDDSVDVVAISHDGKRFVSGGADGKLIVWEMAKGTVFCSFVQEFSVSSITILSRAELVLFTTREREGTGNLKVVDLRDKTIVASKRVGNNGLRFATVSPDKKRLATVGYDRVVQVWDVDVLFPALAKRLLTE
jgi:WD40 repeat protein